MDHLWYYCARKCRRALSGETILIAAALLAATTGQINIVVVVLAAAAGAIIGDGMGYMVGRRLGLRFLRRYGRYIRLDEDGLLIGRYLFFQYGNAVVFFGRFIAVLRMFAALLAGANSMPARRFFFFNTTGGVCWASLFGFGTYAMGAGINKIYGTLSVISLGLLIAAGHALSIFIRHATPSSGDSSVRSFVRMTNFRYWHLCETCRPTLAMSVIGVIRKSSWADRQSVASDPTQT